MYHEDKVVTPHRHRIVQDPAGAFFPYRPCMIPFHYCLTLDEYGSLVCDA